MRYKGAVISILLGAFLGWGTSACTKKSKKKSTTPEEALTPESSSDGLLDVSVELFVQESKGLLHVANAPQGSTLHCLLDEKELEPCEDQEHFTLPKKNGTHALTVSAKVNGESVAVGEARFVIGKPSTPTTGSLILGNSALAVHSDLTLIMDEEHQIAGRAFIDGMDINQGQDATIKFKFADQPKCVPEVRCIYERLDSPFESQCSTNSSFEIKANTMAKGLQFLKVQASCEDKVGEPLIISWYGVPEGYHYMQLESLHLTKSNRYIFNLVKASDCAQNLLTYECRNNESQAFSACKGTSGEPNVITNPPAGFSIRPVCNGTAYTPAYPVSDSSL